MEAHFSESYLSCRHGVVIATPRVPHDSVGVGVCQILVKVHSVEVAVVTCSIPFGKQIHFKRSIVKLRAISLPPGSFKPLRTISDPLIVVLVWSAERPAIVVCQRVYLPKPPVIVTNHQIVSVLKKELMN